MTKYSKLGSKNPNWKGGISQVTTTDGFCDLPSYAKKLVMRKITSRIVKSRGCWKWSGLHFKNDRARITFGKNFLAYRVMYVLTHGKLGSKLLLHSCDNPWCMRPSHIFTGTNQTNSKDMVSKRRQAWGDRNGGAKITNEVALAIRERIGGRKLYGRRAKIAEEFGVSKTIVSLIANGTTWRTLFDACS